MTRRNKHAARFGDRYRPPIDWRRFRDGLQKAEVAIHRMTASLRQVADNMRRAREMEQAARQVEAIINGPISGLGDGLAERWFHDYDDTEHHRRERWTFAPHVANMAAPTVAELEAGTPIRIARTSTEASVNLLLYGNAYIQPSSTDPSQWHGEDHSARSPAEFVQYADDILEATGYDPMYPEPHQHTDEPWPYRGF